MSSRVLKRLQQQINKQPELPPPSSDDEDFTINGKQELENGNSSFNPFDLLIEPSSEHEEKEQAPEPVEESEEEEQPSTSKASQQKKKKKRRKKQKNNNNNNNNNNSNKLNNSKVEQELVKTVSTIALKELEEKEPAKRKYGELDADLMKIELKNLNSQYEMLKKFGKRVVKMDNAKRGRTKLGLKTTYMVTAKERWPPLKKQTITMKIVDPPVTKDFDPKSPENVKLQWFAFEHNDEYRKVQKMFYNAILHVDSDFIISLIRQSPYHVDSLIQLSEICKITEDFALAAELIERALYLLESSLHPTFSLKSGLCRMDYRRQENRGFFIVLFKHAQYLEGRACTRTAFELSKLLLTLDPENDPLAVILVIDYYAIRAKRYQWLVDFYEKHNHSRNLCQLPNMAYSNAMALYLVNREGDIEEADHALRYALLMFPGFLLPLLEELKIQPNERLRASAYFKNAAQEQPPALGQLIDLYLCRAKVIWRQHDLMPWIDKNVNVVLDFLEYYKYLAEEYHNKRSMRYSRPPRAVLRHVVLSDFKEKVPLAPFLTGDRESLQMHDPLPPLDADNLYERQRITTAAPTTYNGSLSIFFQSLLPSFSLDTALQQQQQRQPTELIIENPRRLLEQQQQEQEQPVAGNEHGIELIAEGNDNDLDPTRQQMDSVLNAMQETAELARRTRVGLSDSLSYREFTSSINSFVDAMRDVLNFNLPEHLDMNDENIDDLDVDSSDN